MPAGGGACPCPLRPLVTRGRDPLRNPLPEDWRRRLRRFFLALDAWIDFSLFRSRPGAREGYERFSTFMDRFHVAGWRRWRWSSWSRKARRSAPSALVLMLALAIPAFRETSDDDWLKKSELAVTFLDRYGNEVGPRGIRHNDSIPLDAVSRPSDQGGAGDRGPALLRAFRHRSAGHRARAGRPMRAPAASCRAAPRITQQLAKNLFLIERAHARAQDQGSVPRAVAGSAADQERDPEALSRPRLYGRRRLRRRRGGAVLFQQVGARREPGGSRDARRPVQGADASSAPHVNLPAARARANVVLDNLVDAGFMTEGQVFGARRHPATPVDRARRTRAELLSRLGLRRDEEAGRRPSRSR